MMRIVTLARTDRERGSPMWFRFPITLFSSLIIAAGFGTATVHAQFLPLDSFYYGVNGAPRSLNLCTEQIGIVFQPGLSTADLQAAIDSFPLLTAENRGAPIDLAALIGPTAFDLRDPLSRESLADLAAKLTAHPHIRNAHPIYEPIPGYRIMLVDGLYVNFSDTHSKNDIEALIAHVGGSVVDIDPFPTIGRVGYRIRSGPDTDALTLANRYFEDPLTINATPDFLQLFRILQDAPNDEHWATTISPLPEGQWNLRRINWDQVFDTEPPNFGDEVVIAFIDTGINKDHEDLVNKFYRVPPVSGPIVGAKFFRNGSNVPTPNTDPNAWNDTSVQSGPGHGTIGAGIAAAEANNTHGIAGVAWAARIMPVRIFDEVPVVQPGFPYDAGLAAAAITWAVDNGAKVLNCSWGSLTEFADVESAILDARARGSIIVSAPHRTPKATNPPLTDLFWPSSHPAVIAIGGSMKDLDGGANETATLEMSFGPQMDFIAPTAIWAPTNTAVDGYFVTSLGTTSSCAMGAGAVALVCAANPNLTPAQIQAILAFTAVDIQYTRVTQFGYTEIAGPGRDPHSGYGRIDIKAAVDLAKAGHLLVLRDANGNPEVVFDRAGNVIAEGDVRIEASSAQLNNASGDSEFVMHDIGGSEIARMKADPDNFGSGTLFLAGQLYESVPNTIDLDTEVTVPALRVQDGLGATQALITRQTFVSPMFSPSTVPAGSLILRGRLFVSGNFRYLNILFQEIVEVGPDRPTSQGT